MKTIFTLTTLVAMAITGLVSCRLFIHAHYTTSALLTLTSILSVIGCITFISSKQRMLS